LNVGLLFFLFGVKKKKVTKRKNAASKLRPGFWGWLSLFAFGRNRSVFLFSSRE